MAINKGTTKGGGKTSAKPSNKRAIGGAKGVGKPARKLAK
jgi:hypothetical protein